MAKKLVKKKTVTPSISKYMSDIGKKGQKKSWEVRKKKSAEYYKKDFPMLGVAARLRKKKLLASIP